MKLISIIFAAIALTACGQSESPRLIGIGCEGASGPIYADNEDDFPICQDIHPV